MSGLPETYNAGYAIYSKIAARYFTDGRSGQSYDSFVNTPAVAISAVIDSWPPNLSCADRRELFKAWEFGKHYNKLPLCGAGCCCVIL